MIDYSAMYVDNKMTDYIKSCPVASSILNGNKNLSVLDLGCGTAIRTAKQLFRYLDENIANITCVDKLEVEEQLLTQVMLSNKAVYEIIQSDALDFLKSNKVKFNFIIFSNVLHFFKSNYLEVLLHLKQTLSSSGLIYLSTLNHNHDEYIDNPEIIKFDYNSLLQEIKEVGFTVCCSENEEMNMAFILQLGS